MSCSGRLNLEQTLFSLLLSQSTKEETNVAIDLNASMNPWFKRQTATLVNKMKSCGRLIS